MNSCMLPLVSQVGHRLTLHVLGYQRTVRDDNQNGVTDNHRPMPIARRNSPEVIVWEQISPDRVLLVINSTDQPADAWARGGINDKIPEWQAQFRKAGRNGVHQRLRCLKTTTILRCTIASSIPWCSLPWKRNEFPRQASTASVPHHN